MRGNLIALCLFGLTVVMTACQVVAGIASRAVSDELVQAECEHATVPAKPDVESGDGQHEEEIVLAMDLAISIERDANGRTAGFDLDGVCSKASDSTSCTTCNAPDEDDPNGRDNGTATTLSNGFFRALLAGSSKAATPATENPFHLLVALSDYNGQANDPDVTFTFYRSHGLERAAGSGVTHARGDGSDVWSTTDDSYLKGRAPSMVANGWVRDHRAIVKIDRLAFDYAGSDFVAVGASERLPIELDDVVVVPPLVREANGATRVHGGALTGRWSTKALLSSLAFVPDNSADPNQPKQLCGDDEAYRILRRWVCINADIASRAVRDRKGTRCDALSIVFNIDAIEGKRGETRFQRPLPTPGCGGNWTDDCSEAWKVEGCE